MVKNHNLAKSISDAAWSAFRQWVEYFGKVFGVATVAVPPHYTSQNCSNCGEKVQKSLSMRTHRCHHCGFIIDRDWNAAINILELALRSLSTSTGSVFHLAEVRTVGHTGCDSFSRNHDFMGD
jgi:putative transposase